MTLPTQYRSLLLLLSLAFGSTACQRGTEVQARMPQQAATGARAAALELEDTLGTLDPENPGPLPTDTAGAAHALRDTVLQGDDGRTIDVLVVYTRLALNHYREMGRDIHASIDSAAEQANTAFANSKIDLRVNVVHRQEVDYVESTRSGRSDLGKLAGERGRQIRELRDRYRADQVTLIRYYRGGQNVAWTLNSTDPSRATDPYSRAYSVVKTNCVNTGYRCFTHELAHNLGASHDRAHGSGGLHRDSYGYSFNAVLDSAGTQRTVCFGTMQDYKCAKRRILHFSNPDVTYLGVPTGVRGVADNARAIRDAKLFVANYRQSRDRAP